MFFGKNLTYIRHERNKGVSKKNDKEYDFATITLSDGLESFKVDLQPYLTEMPVMSEIKKGDKINVVLDTMENFGKTNFIINEITKGA